MSRTIRHRRDEPREADDWRRETKWGRTVRKFRYRDLIGRGLNTYGIRPIKRSEVIVTNLAIQRYRNRVDTRAVRVQVLHALEDVILCGERSDHDPDLLKRIRLPTIRHANQHRSVAVFALRGVACLVARSIEESTKLVVLTCYPYEEERT